MSENTSLPADLLSSPSFQLERLRRRTRDFVASQATLGEILGVDRSDMVRLVDSLEKRSLAKRVKDPKDRRRQIISVTKKGTKTYNSLSPLVASAEDKALDESTSKQLKHLSKLAKAIISTEEA